MTHQDFEALKKMQTGGELPTNEELKKISTRIKKNYLNHVVVNLQEKLSGNKELLELLNNLKLDVKSHITFSPVSQSYRIGESRFVDIDMGEILSAQYFCDMGSLALIRSSKVVKLIKQIMFQYGQDLIAALKRGVQDTWPKLDLTKLGLSQSCVEELHLESIEIMLTFVTFLVLHEIAHHKLGHTSHPPPKSLEQSRNQELAADFWAIQKMNEMDYSLVYLEVLFTTFTLIETIQSGGDQLVYESENTHPRWDTRGGQLVDFIHNNQAPQSTWISLRSFDIVKHQHTGQHLFFKYELMFPRNPADIGTNLAFFYINNQLHIVAIEYGPEGAFLYENDTKDTFCIHVKTPFAFSSEVDWYIVDKTNAETIKYQFNAKRISFAYYNEEEKGGIKVRDFLRMSPLKELRSILYKVEEREDVRTEMDMLLKESLINQGNLMLRYKKCQVSFQDFISEGVRLSTETAELMRAKMGDRNFKMYQTEVLKNKAVQLGMDKLLGRSMTN